MTDQKPENSLEDLGDDLGRRIKHARKVEEDRNPENPKLKTEASGFGQAFRLGTEMLSALLVGVGLGWLLDNAFDTKPWFMITCIFLGGAAGVLNVYKTAMKMANDFEDGFNQTSQEDSDKSN
ncbi:AtpZ/AtpI family protein [Magnetovibrio sp. PR-2]|uniref:AtpZ/AtpI family protein n=1 Tax=Magnetovibrio sp. PR-2 TaxID=3120356 RepID=UPI002FCE5A0E